MRCILFNILVLIIAFMLAALPIQAGGGGGGGDADNPPAGGTPSGTSNKSPEGYQQPSTPIDLPSGTGPIFTTTTDDPANAGQLGPTVSPQGASSPAPTPAAPPAPTTSLKLPQNFIKNNIDLINQALQQANMGPLDPAAVKRIESGAVLPTMQALQGGGAPQIDPHSPFGRPTPPAGALAGMGNPQAYSGPIDEATELKNLELQAIMMQHLASMGIAATAGPVAVVTYGITTSVAGNMAGGASVSQTIIDAAKAGIFSATTLHMSPAKGEAYSIIIFNLSSY